LKNVLRIDGDRITDWATFHDVFAEALGFPGFYGRNMDAWIDCMSYIDDPSAGMSTVHINLGDVLSLVVENASSLKERCPEQFNALVECAAFVNWRAVEAGGSPLIALAFNV
jgi:RNAse (barnase) inhibitor barstar